MSKTTINRRELLDPETGEIIEVTEVIENGEKDSDFDKFYAGTIAMIAKLFGSKQWEVAVWIIDNRNHSNNQIVATQEEIAEKVGVSRKTVNKAINKMIENDIMLMKHQGVYRLNPSVIFKGGMSKKANVLFCYRDEKNGYKKAEKTAKTAEVEV
jgi:DNA-binding XRE family transcriptional regulator